MGLNKKITIFKDIVSLTPNYITVLEALNRIKNGKSKDRCEKIRIATNKNLIKKLKDGLPSVLFSGEFKSRDDNSLINHSGLVILDFDKLNAEEKKKELIRNPIIYACWISPSGTGVKALVKIKYPDKHRQHLKSIFNLFPEIDKQNINEARVCFESYDSEIYINENSEIYADFIEDKKPQQIQANSENKIIDSILKWLTNRGDAFVEGERNLFIYKLASACCRFGLSENDCNYFCQNQYSSSDFTSKEIDRTLISAYKKNDFASAEFKDAVLINKSDKKEVEINSDIYNLEIKPQEVIFGDQVRDDVIKLYNDGYENVESTGILELDEYFKWKRGEVTLFSGYGNVGKSTYLKFLMLIQILFYNKKVCFYSPEEYPAHEFYHDFVEMYFGMNCLSNNPNRPLLENYLTAYDDISKKLFFVYPTKGDNSPAYIKQIFLELIIKENVEFCCIDPFNQLDNDYNSAQNSSKYLERLLGDFSRFAIQNQIFFPIIAHPKSPKAKENNGNYPCPDVFDMNDGAMWNNKLDNIIIFHKPFMQTNPDDTTCEHHSKKIRRQKIVGKKGWFEFNYDKKKRRFIFNGKDYLSEVKSIKNTEQVIEKQIDCPF